MQSLDKALVYSQGELKEVTVVRFDDARNVWIVRLPNGQFMSVREEDLRQLPDRHSESETIEHEEHDQPELPDEPEENKPSIRWKNEIIALAVTAFVVILLAVVIAGKPEKELPPTPPKSEAMTITERINARNLEKVPLIESCSKLKAIEAENEKDWKALQNIRNK